MGMQHTGRPAEPDNTDLERSRKVLNSDQGSNKRQTALTAIQDVISRQVLRCLYSGEAATNIDSRYVDQMLYGCGNPECKQMLCDNGRQNVAGRPIRRYTPRSARAIALTLASGPRPRSRLCAQQPDMGKRTRFEVHEGPRDPSSIIQLLADTEGVRRIETPTPPVPRETEVSPSKLRSDPVALSEALRTRHEALDRAERRLELLGTEEMSDNTLKDIVEPVCENLLFLVILLPPELKEDLHGTHYLKPLDTINQDGQTQPRSAAPGNTDIDISLMPKYSDIFENAHCLRLLRHCLSVIARMMKIEYSTEVKSVFQNPSTTEHIAQWLENKRLPSKGYALVIWLKTAFLKHWNGGVFLREGTISLVCLRLLASFTTDILHNACANLSPTDCITDGMAPNMIDLVPQSMDAVEMAQTWFEASTHRKDGLYHLLDFKVLFKTAQRAEYFRILNHLRMQQAHDEAEKASALRARAARSSFDPDSDVRSKFLEEHYLLLNVGRKTVLSDALNEIWQRRSGELLRPLRVRLGEMDAFEVGHDLGGVQIEFFNLLCKEVFSEQLGMFTSDSASGLSYFRSGCLQPLYMFELFGLLFGLAIYNGIMLPVSFPLVFYKKLLGLPCDELENIRDGWPAMYNSLNAILKEDVPGLECVFALEANGVRLSISSFEEEPETETLTTTTRVVEATSISHQSERPDRKAPQPQPSPTHVNSSIVPENLNWPGWCFESPLSGEPFDLTPGNKHRYVQAYTSWLTHASVAAQWHHFLSGFHRIVPSPHIQIFTAIQLQSIVEGTPHISIPDLRAATEYEGYNPNSTYIHTFWSVVASWPQSKQKQLLKFVTAAERVPVGGAGNVTFKISRLAYPGAEESLPTSSTCFGTLYLPRYEGREVLEKKLGVALEMGGEGFGTG